MSEYEQSIEHFIGIYVAIAGPPELAEIRRKWAAEWFAEHDRQVAEKAWVEGAKCGYDYGRYDEKMSLAYAAPTASPYQKEARVARGVNDDSQ